MIASARFAERVVAACDLVAIASGWRFTRGDAFLALTDPNEGMPPGFLGRLVESFPPARFDVDRAPVAMLPANPRLN